MTMQATTKTESKKLNLKTETVAALQSEHKPVLVFGASALHTALYCAAVAAAPQQPALVFGASALQTAFYCAQ
jgi:hypothetical protein